MLDEVIDKRNLPDFDKVRRTRRIRKILIVEDDRFTANLIEASVSGHFSKIIARTGKEAVEKYLSEAPDMIFLDIELPDVSGLEVLDKLKDVDKNIYAVILSGHGNASNVTKAVGQKVKGFINKPFSREQLLPHIDKLAYLNKNEIENFICKDEN